MRCEDATRALLRSLRAKSASFPNTMQEIESAIANERYRRAFLLMHELQEQGKWKPSPEEERWLEDFWWEYAN